MDNDEQEPHEQPQGRQKKKSVFIALEQPCLVENLSTEKSFISIIVN
jgi:hypothetical protein